MRAGKKVRVGGLAKTGYCASLKRYFHGVREHLVFTPGGRIAHVEQLPGNRHDVQGLYALLKTTFRGHLIGDNAYWPKEKMRSSLEKKGIRITAESRSNWHFQYSEHDRKWLKKNRSKIERRIGLFDAQFHANRTLCRSRKHYIARRWTKALSHNTSRHINDVKELPSESLQHFRLAA